MGIDAEDFQNRQDIEQLFDQIIVDIVFPFRITHHNGRRCSEFTADWKSK